MLLGKAESPGLWVAALLSLLQGAPGTIKVLGLRFEGAEGGTPGQDGARLRPSRLELHINLSRSPL